MKMRVISYPKFFFVWPLMLAPVLCELALSVSASPATAGLLYFGILFLVLITLGFDLDRNTIVFAGLIIAVFLLCHRVLHLEGKVPSLLNLFAILTELDLTYHKDFARVLAVLTSSLFAGMLFWSRINDCWVVTSSEFRHSSLGVVDRTLARGAKSIKASYPDMLEFFLGLTGTIYVFDAKGEEELVRIEHVPFLPLKLKKIQKILAGANSKQEAELEDEQVSKGTKKTRKKRSFFKVANA